MGRLTAIECRDQGVLFFYRGAEFVIRGPNPITTRLKAEIADRAAVLRNASTLPDNGARHNKCSTCGDKLDEPDRGRGGTCDICIAAWRAVLRERGKR